MIVSLLYHDVVARREFDASGFLGADADLYKMDRTEFDLHLQEIKKAVPPDRVVLMDSTACEIGPQALLFTFDDDGCGARLAAEILEGCGWRGHFFVTTDYIGTPGSLCASEIRELHERGHVEGSHSCSHPSRMSYCTRQQLQQEWEQSTLVLSNILGVPIRTASVPGGYFTPKVAEAAAFAKIEVLFTSEPTTRSHRVQGCSVLGRYSIAQGMKAQKAAQIASGRAWPRLMQALGFKKGGKAALGNALYRDSQIDLRGCAASQKLTLFELIPFPSQQHKSSII